MVGETGIIANVIGRTMKLRMHRVARQDGATIMMIVMLAMTLDAMTALHDAVMFVMPAKMFVILVAMFVIAAPPDAPDMTTGTIAHVDGFHSSNRYCFLYW